MKDIEMSKKPAFAVSWAEAFRSDRKQFAKLFANMLNGFMYCKIIVDENGKPVDWVYLDVNDAFEKITGYGREKVLGKKVSDLHPDRPPDLLDSLARYGKVALTGEPIQFEFYRESLGKWLYVSAYSPKKEYFIAIFEDVTKRKKAEESLKESEERLKRSQEIAHLGSWELDLVKNNLTWSDEVYRIFGLKPQEFGATYQAFLDLVHPDDRAVVDRAYTSSLSTGKESYEIEHRIIRRDTGEVRIVHEKCTHTRDASGQIVQSIGMVHDITESKEMQRKLEDYTKNLEELIEARTRQLKEAERLAAIGATAGMVGHDIRNPLQSILNELFLAKAELSAITNKDAKENLAENIANIENDIIYVNKIVQDLQDFAKPLNPQVQETNLKGLIEELLLKNKMPANIQVNVEVAEEIRKILSDASFIQRILNNLILNATQAMPSGGKLEILAHKKENDIIIVVEDTGSGIPEEAKPKLFTPMFTTKSKGQGFGLAVVKRMTEALGGTVSFESEIGKGTRFILWLPQNDLRQMYL